MCGEWYYPLLLGLGIGLIVGGLFGYIWGYRVSDPKSHTAASSQPEVPTHWYDNEKDKALASSMFAVAGLTEHQSAKLDPGTYSNEEIARKFKDPYKLLRFLMNLPRSESEVYNRSIASIALDKMFSPS
jgi:hypothetical protein